ncbi:cytochrome P450 [Circinella umbellata]|nr:cytochrome P450 [Circinella umbellata]
MSSSMILINSIKGQVWSFWLRTSNTSTATKKISISVAVVLVSLYTAYWKLLGPPKEFGNIPQVGFFKYISNRFKSRPYDDVLKDIIYPVALKTNHGSYAAFALFGWSIFVTQPEAAKKLLSKSDLFPKMNIIKSQQKHTIFGRFAVGPNIIFLPQGPHWKAQRSILNPAFHRSQPVQLFGELTQKLFVELDKVVNSTSIDVHSIMTRWTLDAIGIAGFDFDFHAITDKNSEWVTRYHHIMQASSNPVFHIFPFLENPRLRFLFPSRKMVHHELDLFLAKMQEIITHKREILNNNELATNKRTNEKDLLTLMLESAKEENDKLTDEELLSNICGFFVAGHDTTANALSYVMYNLATHPKVQEKVREEANQVLGNQPVDVLPTREQINKMPYTQMVIKETLRLNVVAETIVPRKVTEDTDLGGVLIKKGAQVQLDIMGTHRNPKVWKNPDSFDPERFAPGGEAEKVAKMGNGWVPFSNGARMCIGLNFSLTEQRVFIPMLLRKYELSLPDNSIHKDKVIFSGIGQFVPVHLQINMKKRY